MDDLRSKLLHLGPTPQCVRFCTNWDDHCRELARAVDMPALIKDMPLSPIAAIR